MKFLTWLILLLIIIISFLIYEYKCSSTNKAVRTEILNPVESSSSVSVSSKATVHYSSANKKVKEKTISVSNNIAETAAVLAAETTCSSSSICQDAAESNVIIEFFGKKTNTIWVKKEMSDENEESKTESNEIISEEGNVIYKSLIKSVSNE